MIWLSPAKTDTLGEVHKNSNNLKCLENMTIPVPLSDLLCNSAFPPAGKDTNEFLEAKKAAVREVANS